MKRTEIITAKNVKIERQEDREVKSDGDVPGRNGVSAPGDRDMIIRRVQSAPVGGGMSKIEGHGGRPSCPWCIISRCECLCGL